MKHWNTTLSTNYNNFNLLEKLNTYQYISNYIDNYINNKKKIKSLDLGCGNAYISELLKTNFNWTNIDKYPPKYTYQPVIKIEILDFLKKQHSNSFNLIISTFASHHFTNNQVINEIKRILINNGYYIVFIISTNSKLFNNLKFNNLFFSKGFGFNNMDFYKNAFKDTIVINSKIDYNWFCNFINNKSWSNLELMTTQEIQQLINLIPKNLENISLTIDINIINKI